MSIEDFQDRLTDELSAIIAGDFNASITNTTTVPSPNDAAITFPNLDAKSIGCKAIETCVLHVDIRGSTALNNAHRKETMVKLYSAFVRGMVRCADHYSGKVRGIIGDRVMVVFDSDHCGIRSVETAVLMNTVSRLVLNRLFKHGEIQCGIGIDYGKMLVTKTGVIRQGAENSSYQSLVWLGKPANVASKLADNANKTFYEEKHVVDELHEVPGAFSPPSGALGLGLGALMMPHPPRYEQKTRDVTDFLNDLTRSVTTYQLIHRNPVFRNFTHRKVTKEYKTRAILATIDLVRLYRREMKGVTAVALRDWTIQQHAKVSGYTGPVFGCKDGINPEVRKRVFRMIAAPKRGGSS